MDGMPVIHFITPVGIFLIFFTVEIGVFFIFMGFFVSLPSQILPQ